MNAPLFPKPPSPSPSTSAVIRRLSSFLILAATSLWANHQSSDLPFYISVPATSASHRFNLLFASNGRASAAIFRAASAVDAVLFPDSFLFPRKPLRQISLLLSPHNLSSSSISSTEQSFTIFLSADIPTAAVPTEVTKAVARVLLWDGGGAAPGELIEALADYLSAAAAGVPVLRGRGREGECLGDAGFVEYWERRRPGFVARLNRGMRERWSEAAADEALGLPTRRACSEYRRRRDQRRAKMGGDVLLIV